MYVRTEGLSRGWDRMSRGADPNGYPLTAKAEIDRNQKPKSTSGLGMTSSDFVAR